MTADLAAITGIEVPTGLLIGGQWTTGRSGTLPVVNPATEDAITEVADASPEDGLEAVGAAAAALPGWAATPPRQRAECLRKAFELMTERSEQLARLMVVENGKALRDARGEILYAAEFFRWYAEEAVRIDGHLSVAPSGANKIMVTRQPVGVSYLITPWNFPAAMATRKIGPALARRAGRPARQGRGSRADGVQGVLLAGVGDLGDRLLGRGIDDRQDAPLAR